MTENYLGLKETERRDYFDVMKNLPRLREGTRLIHPSSLSNPIAEDIKTGVYYIVSDGVWKEVDK